jgi:hypothetical protein
MLLAACQLPINPFIQVLGSSPRHLLSHLAPPPGLKFREAFRLLKLLKMIMEIWKFYPTPPHLTPPTPTPMPLPRGIFCLFDLLWLF